MTQQANFEDRAEAFINMAWDKGLTVYVSRPVASAKIKALPASRRHEVLRRDDAGALLFGCGKNIWRLCDADDIRAR